MSTGTPWRSVVEAKYPGTTNLQSISEFRNSYPEFAGLKSIVRGRMTTLNQSPRYRFHFLVNPSDIQTNYQVANDLRYSDPDFNLSGANLAALGDGLMTVTFSLMLDRTYEVHRGNPNYTGGVLHDVFALERVLGPPSGEEEALRRDTRGDRSRSQPAAEGSDALYERMRGNLEPVLNGVITHKPVRVLFGAADAFSFDGFVTSLGVHYTHFSYRMVPTRAGVSISMSSLGMASMGGTAPVQSAPGTQGDFFPT